MLVRLRVDHPSCTIRTRHIRDVRLGENIVIFDRAILNHVRIESFSYVSCDSTLINVEVGKFCSVGPNVIIGLAQHPSKTLVSSYPAFYSNYNEGCPLSFRDDKVFDDSAQKTCLGNDVWIGSNAIIPGGIRVGTGAIVAAGSVVVKDVPAYAIVGGNPAKVIRLRFSDEQIEMLLASEWWNWPIEKLRHHADSFVDVEKFRAAVDS